MKKTLVIWNGMENEQVSGGDMFTKKVVERFGKFSTTILSENAKKIVNLNSNFFVTDNKITHNVSGMVWLYFKRVIKSINFLKKNKKNYDLVISSSPFFYDLLPGIFAKSKQKSVVLFHILPKRVAMDIKTQIRFLLASIEQKISFFLIRQGYNTILVGNIELSKQIKQIFPEHKTILINAGIETGKIDSIGKIKKDENLGVFVGRLTTQKGILDLVSIVKEINAKKPKFRLLIVGDGPDKQQFLDKIKKEKINSIEIKGFVDEKTKYELLKKAKFFIFPSYEEGWGIALAEALYCECTCFCYELPHYKKIFGEFPFYIKIGNKKQMTESVLKNYTSKIANGQKTFIKKYDYGQVISEVIKRLD